MGHVARRKNEMHIGLRRANFTENVHLGDQEGTFSVVYCTELLVYRVL
jgi:hypothetical protein